MTLLLGNGLSTPGVLECELHTRASAIVTCTLMVQHVHGNEPYVGLD